MLHPCAIGDGHPVKAVFRRQRFFCVRHSMISPFGRARPFSRPRRRGLRAEPPRPLINKISAVVDPSFYGFFLRFPLFFAPKVFRPGLTPSHPALFVFAARHRSLTIGEARFLALARRPPENPESETRTAGERAKPAPFSRLAWPSESVAAPRAAPRASTTPLAGAPNGFRCRCPARGPTQGPASTRPR